MKCLRGPDGMTSLAVVWRPLIYCILVLFFYPKLGISVPFFHLASYKTSEIKLLNPIGSLLTIFCGRILVFIRAITWISTSFL